MGAALLAAAGFAATMGVVVAPTATAVLITIACAALASALAATR